MTWKHLDRLLWWRYFIDIDFSSLYYLLVCFPAVFGKKTLKLSFEVVFNISEKNLNFSLKISIPFIIYYLKSFFVLTFTLSNGNNYRKKRTCCSPAGLRPGWGRSSTGPLEPASPLRSNTCACWRAPPWSWTCGRSCHLFHMVRSCTMAAVLSPATFPPLMLI